MNSVCRKYPDSELIYLLRESLKDTYEQRLIHPIKKILQSMVQELLGWEHFTPSPPKLN